MTSAPSAVWDRRSFWHEGCLFSDHAELVETSVPVITEGLARSEAVVIVATEDTRRALLAALGADSGRLAAVVTAEDFWSGPHRTVLRWARLLAEVSAGGQPVRVIAEPWWLSDPAVGIWHRFESAVNRAFSGMACYVMCVHDRRRVGAAAQAEIARTHPVMREGGVAVRSARFVPPHSYVPAQEPLWSDPPPAATSVAVSSAAEGRAALGACLPSAAFGERWSDMLLAVTEVVANSVEAGGRPVITAWMDGRRAVVEVGDDGAGGIDPLAGYLPPNRSDESGRGLWLARAVADDATIRSGPAGSSVRMWFAPPARA